MPLDANCPKCQHVFPITEARGVLGVQCPGCETELTTEFRKRPTTEPGQHPYELLVSPGRPAGATPLRNKKPRADEDENEMRGGGGMGIVVAAGLGALLLALGGLGTTGYLLFTNLDTSDATINHLSSSTPSKGGSTPRGGGITPRGGGIPPRGGGITPRGGGDIDDFPGGGNPGGRFPDPGSPFPPSPRQEFDLKPVIGPTQAITPPPINLTSPVTLQLPGQATAVAVGGNGRYLVFHCRDQGRLVVFDASRGQIVANEATERGNALMAAGQTRLVLLELNNVMRVYDLPNLKKRYDSSGPPLPPHGVNSIAMGSATNGPLLACNAFGEVILMNIDDNGATPVEGSKANIGGDLTVPIRASANGKLFVRGGFGNTGKSVIATEWASKWKTVNAELPDAYPAPDGRHILGYGMITLDNGKAVGKNAAGPGNGVWYVPAVSGNHFLRLTETKEGTGPQAKQVVSLSVHRSYLAPEREKALTLGVLPETDGIVQFFFGSTHPLDQHLFLVPDAKLLVVLPTTKDKLVLRKVEMR